MSLPTPLVPEDVLRHWPELSGGTVAPFGNGLINGTFLVESRGRRAVLQRLHPVFDGVVNEDIDAVTSHLEAKGLVTPRIVRTSNGKLWVQGSDGHPWRVLTYVNGTSHEYVDSPDTARRAAALLASFHVGVSDIVWQYRHVRSSVHDTPKHLATLERAVAEHSAHRLHGQVAPLAERILERGAALPSFDHLPKRHVHGDPKIANFLFDATGNAVCLVDLDTVGLMPWPHEMGDALRSWCNPAGEDTENNSVDLALFQASMDGYAPQGRALVTAAEVELLVDGLSSICLELSARFLADALNESYFGWNAKRYASRGEHNLVRALGQWSLHQSVEAQRGALQAIVGKSFEDLLRSRA